MPPLTDRLAKRTRILRGKILLTRKPILTSYLLSAGDMSHSRSLAIPGELMPDPFCIAVADEEASDRALMPFVDLSQSRL